MDRTVDSGSNAIALCTPDPVDKQPDLERQECQEEHEDIKKVQQAIGQDHFEHLKTKFKFYLQGMLAYEAEILTGHLQE